MPPLRLRPDPRPEPKDEVLETTPVVHNLGPVISAPVHEDAPDKATTKSSRAQLRRLFERSDELRYSGRPNGTGTISPENRREVLELIENLRV